MSYGSPPPIGSLASRRTSTASAMPYVGMLPETRSRLVMT